MKKLGLIGGTSWHSTVDYYRLINQIANDRLGTDKNPELMLYSINLALMFTQDWELITKEFIDIAKKLETSGMDGLVLCANTTHKIAPAISEEVDLPIIHIADAMGKYAQAKGLQKLGLLGTKPTMTGEFISQRIEDQFGITCIVPDGSGIDLVHHYVVDELVQGKFTDECREAMKSEMDGLKERGAEGIILGCTELPILFNGVEYELPLLDSMHIHAAYCVDFILS